MSKDIIVLTPNGRRQKVHCTPDTSILQVLEDVCEKQGYQSTDYDLKHHNHILDPTITIRWSNLPNKAMLEMVDAERTRKESNVTIGLLLEDGERRTADFSPNTSLFDLVSSLAPEVFSSLTHPTILYMRQEVTGEPALRGKTLRQMGLIGGRAILRLLNKAEKAMQANVSAVYRRPFPPRDDKDLTTNKSKQPTSTYEDMATAGPSDTQKQKHPGNIDPIDLIKKEKDKKVKAILEDKKPLQISDSDVKVPRKDDQVNNMPMEIDDVSSNTKNIPSNTSLASQDNFERRLLIEEEVIFVGTQKAIAFIPEGSEEELEDLPDDFYELSIDEVRRLYNDLQQHRLELENTPLVTAAKREDVSNETSQQKLSVYKNVVVRVQFPDHIVLQGIFSPTDKIEDVNDFIKAHLQTPDEPFLIFTTPLKETLDPNMTLLEAKFVPCVHMHFKWLQEKEDPVYLKKEIYSQTTTSDAASILASKYRAPSRRKTSATENRQISGSSTSKNSKVPKWFKK